jgi:putative membrane protein
MRHLFLFLKGMLMGAADLVPGVSGGTIALITGIYKELLESINSFSWNTLKNIKKEGLTDVWKKLNGFFLLTVFGGIITSILLLSQILEWFIINEPIGLWSFFFGLLIASIVYLIKTDLSLNISSLLYLCFGAVFSFLSTQLQGTREDFSLWYLFISGFIGVSAMILPGLSGAYILFVMGVYQTILSNVRQAQELLFDFNQAKLFAVVSVLGVFILGMIFGIKVFSKILTWLLKLYPKQIMAVLIGLMIGALHKVWPWQKEIIIDSSSVIEKKIAVFPSSYEGGDPQIIKALILMFLGFIILFVLERTKSIKKK